MDTHNKYTELNTNKKIKEYTRNIIDDVEICDNIKDKYPNYFDYFTTFLFPRHYNYPNKFINMVNIGIKTNPKFNNLEVYIIKEDDTIEDVSALSKCVTGKKSDNVTIAMRNAIDPQIKKYRSKFKLRKIQFYEISS